MNLNPDKCHLPLNINEQNTLNTGNLNMKDSLCGKVHGIANHIEAKKYWRNIWRHRKRILMNAFFKPQFNYCPFIWTCCNHSLISKIYRLHERCLRIVYSHQILRNFSKKMVLSLFNIKISDFKGMRNV